MLVNIKIEECQREILEAREMVEEAERSLTPNEEGIEGGDASVEKEREEIDRNEERLESIKAAFISAIVGTFAGLPISFTQATSSSQLILPIAINFVSCALFGVTFRYTIRRDLDNAQLKTGTSAAFGLVKGMKFTTSVLCERNLWCKNSSISPQCRPCYAGKRTTSGTQYRKLLVPRF